MHLLDVAGTVFSERGYAAASIDQIALRAGVGKQTIYSRYGGKAGLFRAVASHMLHAPLLTLDCSPTKETLEDGLQQRLILVLRAAVEPEYVALFRLFLREATVFPDVFEAFRQVRDQHVEQPLTTFIGRYLSADVTPNLPVARSIELLMAMLNSFISLAALQNDRISPERIEAEAFNMTRLFLHGALAT